MKKIVILFISLMLVIVGIVTAKYKDNKIVSIPINTSVWKKTEIKNKAYIANASMEKFDLKQTITESDYVFSGTVINREEFEVEWTDENGEEWGPFPSSIIEVKVNKEYYGTSPVKGNVIKVYYTYSFSTIFKDSFLIEDNNDYVFITRALDEEFVKQKENNNPEDKFEQEKYADVYISNTYSNLMAIENDTVYIYNEFFSENKDVMNKTIAKELAITDKVVSYDTIENEWFIALNLTDFNKAFSDLFKSQEELTTTNDFSKLQEDKVE